MFTSSETTDEELVTATPNRQDKLDEILYGTAHIHVIALLDMYDKYLIHNTFPPAAHDNFFILFSA